MKVDEVLAIRDQEQARTAVTESDKKQWLGDMFNHHYNNNPQFKAYCDGLGMTPKVYDGPDTIPAIPISAFKKNKQVAPEIFVPIPLLSVPREQIGHLYNSSGTSGQRSMIMKDQVTYERSLNALVQASGIFGLEKGGHVFLLTPQKGIGMWMADAITDTMETLYGADVKCRFNFEIEKEIPLSQMGLEDFSEDLKIYVPKMDLEAQPPRPVSDFDPAAINQEIAGLVRAGEYVTIIGAPDLILAVAGVKQKMGLDYVVDTVITGGGFKKTKLEQFGLNSMEGLAQMMTGEFLEDRANFYDVFGMTEHSNIHVSCPYDAGKLHVRAPTVIPQVRDFETEEVLTEDGAVGEWVLLEAAPTSYPSLLRTGDKTILTYDCECGEEMTFELQGRMLEDELASCGAQYSQYAGL